MNKPLYKPKLSVMKQFRIITGVIVMLLLFSFPLAAQNLRVIELSTQLSPGNIKERKVIIVQHLPDAFPRDSSVIIKDRKIITNHFTMCRCETDSIVDTIIDRSLNNDWVIKCYQQPNRLIKDGELKQSKRYHLRHFGWLKYHENSSLSWSEGYYNSQEKIVSLESKIENHATEQYDWWLIAELITFTLSLLCAWLCIRSSNESSHAFFLLYLLILCVSIIFTLVTLWYFGVALLLILLALLLIMLR